MKKHIVYLVALGIVLVIGCQKEMSFETGNSPSEGSLQSDASGDCLPKTVNGTYIAGTPLVPATNTITVQVSVATTGSYLVYTDTVNGYYFRATGTFTTLGSNTVTLHSNGTPFAAGINNFVVNYDSTVCDIQVTVLPAGAGGPAVFTLAGAPTTCTGATVAGTYGLGIALIPATNTATISVNVTTIGTYSITTAAVNGMIFTASGNFTVTGVQNVVLAGSGTPTTQGSNTITINIGSPVTSTCTFNVTVVGPAVGTLSGGPAPAACTPATVNGTYAAGTALVVGNTVQVQVNITTVGAYSITTNMVDGFSFTASGTFTTTGIQNVILNGTGNPTTAGPQTFTVTFLTSTCTFVVTVTGTPPVAVCTLSGGPGACTPSTVNGTYTVGTILTAGNTVQVQINATVAGTYSVTTGAVTGFSFAASGTAVLGLNTVTLVGTGTPTTAGPQTFTATVGTSSCTFVVTVAAAPVIDYFPRTTNSNWSYEFNDDPTDSLLRVVIVQTLSVPPNTYNIFMPDEGSGLDSNGTYSAGYYRKSGGDYFERLDVGAFIGFDNPQWAEYIMVKDNVAAGTNWKSAGFTGTVSGNPLTLRFSYTILQKDVPVSVITSTGTVNYTNVIVVEEKYEQFTGGVWVDITSLIDFYGKSYYARNIGLIKFEAYDASNTLTDWQFLRRKVVF